MGLDTITSTQTEYNSLYKDKVVFTNDTDYTVGSNLVVENNEGNLIIGDKDHTDTDSITYTNFVSDKYHNNFAVKDSTGTEYQVSVATNGVSFGDNTNNIAFVYGGDNPEFWQIVDSSSGKNFVNAYGEGGMQYLYQNGTDIVISNSESANDSYEIWGFSATSKLYLTDNGGDDSLHFGTDDDENTYLSDARLVFNVNSDGSIDYSNFMIVHKDAFSETTLCNAVQNNLVDGVLKFNVPSDAVSSFGIETVSFGDSDLESGQYEQVSVSGWIERFVGDVQAWLEDTTLNANNYESVYAAFADKDNIDPTSLAMLVGYYNVEYNQ